MDQSTLTPRAWLRRLDFALVAPPSAACRSLRECPDCDRSLEDTFSAALAWCNLCRRVYFHAANRLLCEVPDHWLHSMLFEFLERAMEGMRTGEQDRAFSRFLCEQVRLDSHDVDETMLHRRPDQVRIGRLAMGHRLVSPSDVAWVLRFQRCARAHRRRCFGDIAVELGLWRPDVVARLLAIQAERRRGLAKAIAAAHHLPREQLLAAERDFFGIGKDGKHARYDAPFDALMALPRC